ncbi:MAG: hypothetical protein C0507_04780 [Cyanobacteria bacterium PR.3.49]|nr:hypothetical protein [Cyanobacteria bacterium PR.3.49]
MTRSALSISGDGDSMDSRSTKMYRRRELNVSRTVKPSSSNFRAQDESDTSKYSQRSKPRRRCNRSVRQVKEQSSKSLKGTIHGAHL